MQLPHKTLDELDFRLPDLPVGMFTCDLQPGDVIPGLPVEGLQIDNVSTCLVTVTADSSRQYVLLRIADEHTKIWRTYGVMRRRDGAWVLHKQHKLQLLLPTITGAALVEKLKAAHLPVAVLDVESDALSVNAVITSLGIAVGDLATGEVITWLQLMVPTQGQEMRRTDMETVAWWAAERIKNPIVAEAQSLTTGVCPPHVTGTLRQFFESFGEAKHSVHVFANGPEFDNANLMSLYETYGAKVPWRHGNNQSIRTAVLFGRKLLNFDTKYANRPGMIPHFALHDALIEFHYTSETYRAIALHINNPKTIVEVAIESDLSSGT